MFLILSKLSKLLFCKKKIVYNLSDERGIFL